MEEEVQEAPKDEEVQEEDDSCAICFEGKKEALIAPCGHISTCMNCTNSLKEKNQSCPICRGNIQMIVKAFKV